MHANLQLQTHALPLDKPMRLHIGVKITDPEISEFNDLSINNMYNKPRLKVKKKSANFSILVQLLILV